MFKWTQIFHIISNSFCLQNFLPFFWKICLTGILRWHWCHYHDLYFHSVGVNGSLDFEIIALPRSIDLIGQSWERILFRIRDWEFRSVHLSTSNRLTIVEKVHGTNVSQMTIDSLVFVWCDDQFHYIFNLQNN